MAKKRVKKEEWGGRLIDTGDEHYDYMISYYVTYFEDRITLLKAHIEKLEGVASVIHEVVTHNRPQVGPVVSAHIVRDFNIALQYLERLHNELLVELMNIRNYSAAQTGQADYHDSSPPQGDVQGYG